SMMRDYVRAKYANVRIDGVVVVGDAAAELLLGPGRDLFATSKIVFHAVVSASLRAQAIERGWKGVVFSADHRNTVDLALRLHPNTREVWVIVASTGGDHAQELAVRAQLAELAGRVKMRYFTNTSTTDLKAQLTRIPRDALVLYVRQQDDSNRITMPPRDVLAELAGITPVPIYGGYEAFLGYGTVGGYLLNSHAIAAAVADLVLQVTSGREAGQTPAASGVNAPMFDWNQLQRWRISETQLPSGSIVQ